MEEKHLIFISALLAEVSMAFYVILIFSFFGNLGGMGLLESLLTGSVLMFIIPNIAVYYFYRSIELSKVKTEERYKFYLTVIACYLAAFLVFNYFSNTLLAKVVLSYFLIFLILFVINFRWRISLHAAGIGAASMILFLNNFVIPALIFFALTPFVYWLKMSLRSHGIYQMLTGSIVSFIVSYAVFVLL
ncbi:MAG: hypothetical protein HYW26_00615 [Candidatus Aenigmarchaeota archaeon]|nr:hypothetical protein [Candidatus Aenigmarchaeota archaeon]